jgi:hypothetical protein
MLVKSHCIGEYVILWGNQPPRKSAHDCGVAKGGGHHRMWYFHAP